MKKFFYLLIFSAFVFSCGLLNSTTPEEEAAQAAEVSSALKAGEFVIDINTIYPQIGMAIHDNGYDLVVKDGEITGVLPFFGTSDTPIFGPESAGIELDKCPVKIKNKKVKDGRELSFTAVSSNNDKWDFTITVWSDGTCNLTCFCSSKSIMRYDGRLSKLSD